MHFIILVVILFIFGICVLKKKIINRDNNLNNDLIDYYAIRAISIYKLGKMMILAHNDNEWNDYVMSLLSNSDEKLEQPKNKRINNELLKISFPTIDHHTQYFDELEHVYPLTEVFVFFLIMI